MPSPRHTLASLIEKQLPLDKPHKHISGDRGFKNEFKYEVLTEETQPVFIIDKDYQFITVSLDDTSDTQITQENQVQLNDDSIVDNDTINQVQLDNIDSEYKTPELTTENIPEKIIIEDVYKEETPKERKLRLKKEKEESKKS